MTQYSVIKSLSLKDLMTPINFSRNPFMSVTELDFTHFRSCLLCTKTFLPLIECIPFPWVQTASTLLYALVASTLLVTCPTESTLNASQKPMRKNPLGPILTTPTFTLSHSLGPVLMLDYQPTSKCLLYRVAFSSFDTNISDR